MPKGIGYPKGSPKAKRAAPKSKTKRVVDFVLDPLGNMSPKKKKSVDKVNGKDRKKKYSK